MKSYLTIIFIFLATVIIHIPTFAGLDTDYRGLPFGPMPDIMCEADYLDKLQAICIVCGNPASYTQRLIKEAAQVVIGEMDIYEARCRHCYEAPK